MNLLGIPTSQELTAAGVALEDHAAAQAQALIEYAVNQLHTVLDRLNGSQLNVINGGLQLTIPPKSATTPATQPAT